MTVVLIAYGPNDIRIPCMIFEDFVTAEKICDEIFTSHIEPEDKEEFVEEGMVCISYRCNPENLADPDDDYRDPVSERLFTGYYYGCGGPYRFVLKHVDYNTKFVGFDLD